MSISETSHFIKEIINNDLKNGKNEGRVVTRFPPEPNGYLHIGHAKSICLNFGLANEYQGKCHLRFDDTNPTKEDIEYVDSIKEDVQWLGFDWGENLFFASDYFDILYGYAVELVKKGKAYVCDLTAEEIRQYRGTLKEAGKESPSRHRSIEENLDLLERMKNGEFEDGAYLLRAKIDMASPNMNMRDPAIYRIKKVTHHRTGDQWSIYPMYDFTHGLSDATEGVTHSICTLEFEDHRPLYDWFLDNVSAPCHPQQIEFARLNLTYTMMSKRYLLQLVEENIVSGWDDPRMPTISGLRRKGYTAKSIRNFCDRIGVAKRNSMVEIAQLEHAIREDLNFEAPRAMAVLNPIKVVIENYPEGQSEELDCPNHPERPELGRKTIPFSREIYIERDDFREDPPRKFFRLSPNKEVRLRYAYYITCTDVIKDEETGEIIELRCTYDPETKGGRSPDKRKVKGTLHWVSAPHATKAEIHLYDHLFKTIDPYEGDDFKKNLNPDSLIILNNAYIEPSLTNAKLGDHFQFERKGYFTVDPDSTTEQLIFNRTVSLRDSWAKIEKQTKQTKQTK